MHAREFIGPATVTFLINELTKNRTENQDILDSIDIYVTPIGNPDVSIRFYVHLLTRLSVEIYAMKRHYNNEQGYEYAHTTTRLWRKTRSNRNSTVGCLGVDPNR